MTNQPEPTVGEPGGPDANEQQDGPGGPIGRDLPPEQNPSTDDVLPGDITEPDDKSQEPAEGTSGEGEPPDEPPG